MPFREEVLEDLYDSICADEVQYWDTLSKIAWNLLTQVGRHTRANYILCGKFTTAFLTCIFFVHQYKENLLLFCHMRKYMFMFKQRRVSLQCREDNFKY